MKNDKEYLTIDDSTYTFSMELKRTFFKFSNLFNGNKDVNNNLEDLMNDNWEEIMREIKPFVAEAFKKIGSIIIGNVFAKTPYADMFLAD